MCKKGEIGEIKGSDRTIVVLGLVISNMAIRAKIWYLISQWATYEQRKVISTDTSWNAEEQDIGEKSKCLELVYHK